MGEGETASKGENQSASELLASTRNPVEFIVDAGSVPLKTVSGFQKEGVARITLSFLQITPDQVDEGIRVEKKNGQVVLATDSEPCLLEDEDRIVVHGKAYRVEHDPWSNIVLYKVREEEEKKNLSPESEKTLGRVVDLWQAAVKGEEELNRFLDENLDKETLAEMKEVLAYLKLHPLLQTDMGKIDPWALSMLATEEERVALLREYIYGSYSFKESEEFQKLMQIVDKIRGQDSLSNEEKLFLKALAVSDIASRESIHGGLEVKITPLNERYALANLAENYLVRDLAPRGVFESHWENYQHFAEVMKQQGVLVPDWFSGFRGSEFVYGPAIEDRVADAGGKYFFDSFGESKESMAHIFDHERMHQLIAHAGKLRLEKGLKDSSDKGFVSQETYVETFSLCVRYGGNIEAILASEDLKRTFYEGSSRKLLEILAEVNQKSGDAFKGAKLLFEGLIGLTDGSIKGTLEPLGKYYDSQFNGVRFAERMAAFDDGRRLYAGNVPTESADLSRENIIRIMDGISLEEAKKVEYWMVDQESLDKLKDRRVEYPMFILRDCLKKSLDQLFYEGIMADPQARAEMQILVDSYYQSYAKMIMKKVEENRKIGKTAVVAGGS